MPLNATTAVLFCEELLAIVSDPVSAPVAVGSNCTLRVAVWPEFKVNGKVAPDTVNPFPETLAALTITGEEPVDESVTDCVDGMPTATLPKATLVELMERVARPGLLGVRLRANVLFTPLALDVSVTVCAEVTAATVTVNPAVVALAGTVTEAGTVAAALLLARLTATPPLGAAAARVTVQASVPLPASEALAHESPLSADGGAATPVPLS